MHIIIVAIIIVLFFRAIIPTSWYGAVDRAATWYLRFLFLAAVATVLFFCLMPMSFFESLSPG